jgi:PLD-like domain
MTQLITSQSTQQEISYLVAVQNLIRGTKNTLKAAVAFWGVGADKQFDELALEGGIQPQIICNLSMGGTNPYVIKKLQGKFGKDAIRQSNKLHAKVLIGDADIGVIIGSANMSANGLGFEEGELSGWNEVGIATQAPMLHCQLSEWFDACWLLSGKILPSHLTKAKKMWQQHRGHRGMQNSSFMDCRAIDFEDSNIYVIAWSEDASPDAKQSFLNKQNCGELTKKHEFYYYPESHWDQFPAGSKIIDVKRILDKAGNQIDLKSFGLYQHDSLLDDRKEGHRVVHKIKNGELQPNLMFTKEQEEKFLSALKTKQFGDAIYTLAHIFKLLDRG